MKKGIIFDMAGNDDASENMDADMPRIQKLDDLPEYISLFFQNISAR